MVINITDKSFDQTLQENPKVIVKYFATWCGSCRLFAPKFRRLSDDENYEGIAFIEVDAETNEQSRKAGGVENLPYFATFKDGELLEGMATSKEEKVLEMLEKLKS